MIEVEKDTKKREKMKNNSKNVYTKQVFDVIDFVL